MHHMVKRVPQQFIGVGVLPDSLETECQMTASLSKQLLQVLEQCFGSLPCYGRKTALINVCPQGVVLC